MDLREFLLENINKIRSKKNLQPVTELNSKDRLREDLGLDSLDLAELTVRIENTYKIDVFEDGIVTKVSELIQKING